MLEPQSWKCSLIIQISDEHVSGWRLASHRRTTEEIYWMQKFPLCFQVHSSTRSRVEEHPDPHGDVTPEWKRCRSIVFRETFQSWDTKQPTEEQDTRALPGVFPLRLVSTKPKTNDSFVPMDKEAESLRELPGGQSGTVFRKPCDHSWDTVFTVQG